MLTKFDILKWLLNDIDKKQFNKSFWYLESKNFKIID